MDKNTEKKIKIPFHLIEYSFVVYISILYFHPSLIQPFMSFFKPFMGVISIIYFILLTLSVIAFIASLIILTLKAYTTKLDNESSEPQLYENNRMFIMKVFFIVKSIYEIWIFHTMGYNYAAVMMSIYLFLAILFKFIEKDFATKMLKLRLAWEEPKSPEEKN